MIQSYFYIFIPRAPPIGNIEEINKNKSTCMNIHSFSKYFNDLYLCKFLQGEELNKNGELYIQKYPQLKIKLVDRSSLVTAVVLNGIPKGTTQVFLRGNLTKVAYIIADALCERGIQVRLNCI
jgi:hypothetical protein